ncbi:hypothetical protein RhiirA4_477762, partial [Rhizophagus irregularis]
MGMAPVFNGKSDEDVNEWIEEIETKFESTGRNVGNNNVNITTFAIGGLKGSALRWYREMKEANAGNLVNWTNVANDNNLRERIREKFEGAEKVLRIATRGNVLADVYQIEDFINGLKTELVEGVRLNDPANLNAAITRAKLVERVKNEKLMHEIKHKLQEK